MLPISQKELIVWNPHPKQSQALERDEFEILFGGARGPGKTDAGINWLLYDADNPRLRALIIRRNSDDLKDWVDRANQIYSKLGAIQVGNPPEFKWPSGAIFRTGHLKDENAYTKYQGHEYQRMLIEELTQIPTEESYLRLIASCRTTDKTLSPQVFITTNPGGIGHAWVKQRFVDVAPPFTTYIDPKTERTRIFIKATLDDNPTLTEADPAYIKQLEALQGVNEELYRAWRYGDWDVFAGQVFEEFRRDLHVIRRITPKTDIPHFLSFDWGYSAPFSCHAHAMIPMKDDDTGEVFNRVVTYQEWYGIKKYPSEWAKEIYTTALNKNIKKGIGDSSMFNPKTDGSISIAKEMQRTWESITGRQWFVFEPGTKNRIQRVASTHNWLSTAPDGLPYWLITENCINLIRTLPILVYDEHKPEDVDTTQEDHAYDDVSYYLTSAKFIQAVGSFGSREVRRRKFRVDRSLGITPEGQPAIDLRYFERSGVQKDWRAV